MGLLKCVYQAVSHRCVQAREAAQTFLPSKSRKSFRCPAYIDSRVNGVGSRETRLWTRVYNLYRKNLHLSFAREQGLRGGGQYS